MQTEEMYQMDLQEMNPMEPPEMQMPKPSLKHVKRILSYLKGKYKILLALALICIVAQSVAQAYGSFFIKNLVDGYIKPFLTQAEKHGVDSIRYSGLAAEIGRFALVYLVVIVMQLIHMQIMLRISNKVLRDIRNDMFVKMQKLPISYFDTHSHGDLMSHFSNDVDVIRQMIETVPTVIYSFFTILSSMVVMIRLSWQLSIPVLLGTIGMAFAMGKLGGKSASFFMKQQMSIGNVNGYIEELVNGQKVVKAFTYEDRAKEVFDQKNNELRENATKATIISGVLSPVMSSIGNIIYLFVALIGGFLAIKCGVSAITVGVVASFLPLTQNFVGPVAGVSQQVSAVSMAIAGAGRVFELMDAEKEDDDGYVTLVNCKKSGEQLQEVSEDEARAHKHDKGYVWAWKHPHGDGTLTYKEVLGDVSLTGVDFSYDGTRQVLFDVTVHAKPGQKIALVGSTGAGKTTITNLINRFYSIADGKIRYDDININKIKKADLRRSLGIVLQDTMLFTGTVMENIRYGNLKATDEECIEAAKLANAHEFISKLPQGYDTMLTANGSELSQGQCQLIAIARTALVDPPVMILDEATSSIDTRTEEIVQRGMDALMENRTVFVIAHRLSTVKNSESILVMENGRIVEQGDHASLVAQKGRYYRLCSGATYLE